jgi:hypothetical protein
LVEHLEQQMVVPKEFPWVPQMAEKMGRTWVERKAPN